MEEPRVREINPEDAKLLDPHEIGYITMRDGTIVSIAGADMGQIVQPGTQCTCVENNFNQDNSAYMGPVGQQTTTTTRIATTAPQRMEEGGIVEDRYNYRFYVSGVGYVNGDQAQTQTVTQDYGCNCECHQKPMCDCECHQNNATTTTQTRLQTKKRPYTPQENMNNTFGERFVYTEHVKRPERVTRGYYNGGESNIVRSRQALDFGTSSGRVSHGCVHCQKSSCPHCSGQQYQVPPRKTFVSEAQVKQGPEYLDNYRFKEIKGTAGKKKKK